MNALELMRDIDMRYREVSELRERRFYSIFYSRIDPSDALVLGINPGGDPDTWTEDKLASRSFYEDWEHEYVDCKYAIQEPMLPFLMNVLVRSKEGIRRVPKTNLAFRRSNGVDAFRSFHQMTLTAGQNEAKPFVEEIIRCVSPKVIILEGITALDPFRRKYCSNQPPEVLDEPIFTKHRGQQVRVFCAELLDIQCLDQRTPVIAIGHPSHFGDKPIFGSVETHTRAIVARYV